MLEWILALEARAERAERERDAALAKADSHERAWYLAKSEFGDARAKFSKQAQSARAWARRWKRTAKMFRHQYLYTCARLEKWRTAERIRLLITDYGERPGPQERKVRFARVPEGEE